MYVDLLHTMRIVDPQMKDQALLDAFGRRIRELRNARGLSQEELAFQTGFHRTYIGMIERGERNLSLRNKGVLTSGSISVID